MRDWVDACDVWFPKCESRPAQPAQRDTEDELRNKLTARCLQEWFNASAKGYGASYLSAECRAEYDRVIAAGK